jgi:hypothetical protein
MEDSYQTLIDSLHDIIKTDDNVLFDKWSKDTNIICLKYYKNESRHILRFNKSTKLQRTFYYNAHVYFDMSNNNFWNIGYFLIHHNAWNIFYNNIDKLICPYGLIIAKNKHKEFFKTTNDRNIFDYIVYNYEYNCSYGDDIKWCVYNGFNLDIIDNYKSTSGETILRKAILQNDTSMIEWLIFEKKINLIYCDYLNFIDCLFARGRYDILFRLINELGIDVKNKCNKKDMIHRMESAIYAGYISKTEYDKCMSLLQ